MDSKVTVLVSSCDSYDDSWFPFFKLLKKYWPTRKYPIVLNTESKKYDYEDMGIKTINLPSNLINKKVSWSKRLKLCLKQISSEYILFMLDDFYLLDYVDQNRLDQVIDWMDNDKNVAVFSFFRVEKNKYQDTPSKKYDGFDLRNKKGPYRYNCQAALWRRDDLIKALRNHESAWDWELIGNRRSRRSNKQFYTLANNANLIFKYNYKIGIVRGKWKLPETDELFKKENIKIDYSIRNDRKDNKKSENKYLNKIKLYLKKIGSLV